MYGDYNSYGGQQTGFDNGFDHSSFGHWSEGLNMVIKKDGVSIKLNGDELKQLVASLPRTMGGSY